MTDVAIENETLPRLTLILLDHGTPSAQLSNRR
jgi:hypothetical protein